MFDHLILVLCHYIYRENMLSAPFLIQRSVYFYIFIVNKMIFSVLTNFSNNFFFLIL